MSPTLEPYFTRPDMEQPYYDIANKAMIGMPMAPYPLAATVRYQFRRLDARDSEHSAGHQ